ncbi:hypothetical protein SPI_03164 [Niveomyces insectorum RCEF 264]|uniref:Eisosome protein 1 n=1 Tax=Niveomyces insectorum RCEF 264 TaxID=1081102 RepID=A0A167X4G7_9HYPO|nr:hypothetical protein SPI_03164 [Niveomyces insectorum RCEF 264]
MPLTGPAVQRQPAPHGGGSSYSSMQQQADSHPNLFSRLVYADPRNLPSYPSVGLKDDGSHAAANSAAATSLRTAENQRQQQQQQQQQSPSQRSTEKTTATAAQPPPPPSQPATWNTATTTAALAATANATARSPSPVNETRAPINADSLKAASAAASAALQPSASSAQATTQHRPVIVEHPPPPSPQSFSPRPEFGSTAGSSMAAATYALGSVAGRHQRNASSNETPTMSSAAAADRASSWGNSAASRAFKDAQAAEAGNAPATASAEQPTNESATLHNSPSLRAAKGAMQAAPGPTSSSDPTMRRRTRAASNPAVYRHQKSYSSHYPEAVAARTTMTTTTTTTTTVTAAGTTAPSANALSAATLAHRGPGTALSAGDRRSYVSDAGAVPYTMMNRQMYTSQPPVAPEVDEQKRNDTLHASAIAMAKRMYNPKAQAGAAVGPGVIGADAGLGSGVQTTNLQALAYNLAQERLAKLQDEHQRNRDSYREHYVDPNLGPSSPEAAESSRRFSIRDRLWRHRSSSDSEVARDRRLSMDTIHSQMLPPAERVSAADQQKQRQDRQNVLFAAQRNVRAQLDDIDRRIYAQTGKVHPSVLSSWENKAFAAAQARSNTRQGLHPQSSQIDLGGGRLMSRSEVDRIAARRVQPFLDDINEKAERQQNAAKQTENDRKEEAKLLEIRGREMDELYQKLKREEKEKKKFGKKHKGATNEARQPLEGGYNEAMPAADMSTATGTSAVMYTPGIQQQPTASGLPSAQPAVLAGPERPVAPPQTNVAEPGASTGGVGNRSGPAKLFVETSPEQYYRTAYQDVPVESAGVAGTAGIGANEAASKGPGFPSGTGPGFSPTADTSTNAGLPARTPAEGPITPSSPQSPLSDNESSSASPSSRVKSWLRSRFLRPRARSAASATSAAPDSAGQGFAAEPGNTGKTFIGGHALANAEGAGAGAGDGAGPVYRPAMGAGGLTVPVASAAVAGSSAATAGGSNVSLGNRSSSMRDVALAKDKTGRDSPALGTGTMDASTAGDSGVTGAAMPTGAPVDADTTRTTMPAEAVAPTGAVSVVPSERQIVTEQPATGGVGANDGTGTATEPRTSETVGPLQAAEVAGAAGAAAAVGVVSALAVKNASASKQDQDANVGGTSGTGSTGGTGFGSGSGLLNASIFTNVTDVVHQDQKNETAEASGPVNDKGSFDNDGTETTIKSDDKGNTYVVVPPTATVLMTKVASGTNGADATTFTPPQAIRDPAQKKSSSPVRDSRFLENLEDF